MMRSLISSALKVRLAWWAVEFALPSETDLKKRFRSVLLAVIAAVAGGLLCASCFIFLIIAAGAALYNFTSYTVLQSALIMVAVLMIVVVALVSYGTQKFKAALHMFDETRSYRTPSSEDKLQEIFNGFIEGFMVNKSASRMAESNDNSYRKSA